jgi:hypothetical protein
MINDMNMETVMQSTQTHQTILSFKGARCDAAGQKEN